MRFYPINNTNDQFFNKLYSLYVSAFPELERRTLEGLVHEVTNEKRFHANAILSDNEFVGFINYWKFESFDYLEHIAIDEKIRGRNLGSKAMQLYKSYCNLPIIFEVEVPTNTIAQQRVHFYQRLGFSLLPNSYSQPPYSSKEKEFPMKLMSDNKEFASDNFELIKNTIYSEVYDYFKNE